MNAFLTRRSRAEQSDHQRREQPLDYVRSKERDTGSPLPAILLLAAVCAAAWLWLILSGG